MSIADEIAKIAGGGNANSTHQATVLRTDPDGTTWVSIAGGADETPLRGVLAECRPGDSVEVAISGGKAVATANATSPAATVRSVRAVDSRVDAVSGQVDVIRSDVDLASQAAEEAKEVAEVTGQHFWEDANGAHVTEITKEDWKTEEAKPNPFADVSDQKPYHNLLMNSLGILLRTALKNLVSITRSAIAFFDGDGNGSANVVASFGKDGAQIGYAASTHSRINSDSFGIYEGADRLISFYSDNRLAKMYAGISIPPSYAKYTKAEAAVIYDYIENGVELGQDRQTYNDKETGEATEYHLRTPLPVALPSELTFIDVLDGDGDTLSSADCGGIFLSYDPLVSTDWELYYDAIFDPQAEAEGPLSIEAGGTNLMFDGCLAVLDDIIKVGTVPTAARYTDTVEFRDANGEQMGYLHAQYLPTDKVRMAMGVHRQVGGSDKYRTLTTSIDANGNGLMEFDGDAAIGGALDLTADDKHISMHDSRLDASHGGVPTTGANVSRVVRMMDSSDRQVSRLLLRQAADGRRMASFESHGYDANGNDVWNRLGSIVTANGERTYDVGDPAAFCEVLHVGDYVTNSASVVSTATATYKDLFNFTLAAGTWLVFVTMEFATNANGRRVAVLNTTAGGNGISLQWRSTEVGVSGGPTRAKLAGVLIPTASTKYYVTGWQNSGGDLNLTAVAQAVRIK